MVQGKGEVWCRGQVMMHMDKVKGRETEGGMEQLTYSGGKGEMDTEGQSTGKGQGQLRTQTECDYVEKWENRGLRTE